MRNSKELDWIIAAIRQTYSGTPWHGPSFKKAVRGVDGELAACRIPELSHSIWELTYHLKGWMEAVQVRLSGKTCSEPKLGDFPSPVVTTTAEWKRTLAEFDQTVDHILENLGSLSLSRLDDMVPGRNHTYRPMLIGLAWHTLHHTGQISMIKRALKNRKKATKEG